MTIIQLLECLLLTASVMTNFPESKSLAQATEKKSTCGIRHLEELDMMLTCYFHDNISVLRKDFAVYLYKKEQQSPITVISCGWPKKILCRVAPGYEYEYDIDDHHDHTNVRILNATAEHAGTYTCQVTGESDPGTCTLTEERIQQKLLSSTPYKELTFGTIPAQTAATTLVSDDRQTQNADEQSSNASELASAKDAREGKLTEEHKDTDSQDNTVIYVVPTVVLSIIIIVVVIITVLCCKRRQRSKTVREGNDSKETEESIKLINKSLTENPTEPCDKANTSGADKRISRQEQTNQSVPHHSGDTTCCSPADNSEESGRQQEPEVKTRSEGNDESTKRLTGEPSDLVEKTGIQERGDGDIQDGERNVDGSHLELQQRHSFIVAPKKLNMEKEEDSPVTESAMATGHLMVRPV